MQYSVKDVESTLCRLESAGLVVSVGDGRFTASQQARNEGEQAVKEFQDLERRVANRFESTLCERCGSMVVRPGWDDFLSECLLPLLTQEGAQAASLSLGCPDGNGAGGEIVTEFVIKYDEDGTGGLASCIQTFLTDGDSSVREYVLRQLDARFIVVAAGLDSDTIEALTAAKSKKLQLALVLDTNFLFSVLGWHDNPSNEVAKAVLEVASTMHPNVEVHLLVLPTTVDELQHAVSRRAEQVEHIRWTSNLATAALEFGVPGLVAQYLESQSKSGFSMSIVEYADFLSHDIESTLQKLGVMSVYEDVSGLGMRQDVIDSISDQMTYETQHRAESERRDYQQVRHDMIAYHWVADQRPSPLKTAVDAGYWLVTLDFRLLGFDRFRCRGQSVAQVCLHPSTAIQLLQFWVPRSHALEEAIYSSVRQPLFPSSSLLETEKVTYKIIERLGTLSGIEEISAEAIRDTLADRMLQKSMRLTSDEDEELELIEAAFVRLASEKEQELAEERAKLQGLQRELDVSKDQIRELGEMEDGRKTQVERLKKQVADATSKVEKLDEEVKDRDTALTAVEARLTQAETESAQLRWLLKWAVIPGAVILVVAVIACVAFVVLLDSPHRWIAVGLTVVLALLLWIVIMGSGADREVTIKDTRAAGWMTKSAGAIKVATVTVALGLLINVIWEWVR